MDAIANEVQLFFKKHGVGQIYTVQIKDSTENEWKELKLKMKSVRDVYMAKYKGQCEKSYDFRILTSRTLNDEQEQYLLFEGKGQTYGMCYV